MSEAEHPFGVVIPPDKGDANYEGGDLCETLARALARIDYLNLDPEELAGELAGPLGRWVLRAAMTPDAPEPQPGVWTPCQCGQHPPRQSAPETPHAPATAPNTTLRGSVDAADGSEALRVRLADAALHAKVPTAPPWDELDDYVHDVWLGVVGGVVEEVLDYGRVQRHQGAEQALLDAADEWPGVRVAVTGTVHGWLRVRADELGRQA
jgi:hypothetical protein